MRKKQKKFVFMVVLSAGAVVLLAVQLGPLVFGGGGSRKKAARKKKNKTSPKASPQQSREPHKNMSGGGGSEPTPQPALDPVKLDLSAAGPARFVYDPGSLRSPFAAARFEQVKKDDSLSKMTLKLSGIVQSGQQRVAIIGGRFYTEGDELQGGAKVFLIDAVSVTLTHGENRVRLELSAPDPRVRGP